MFGILALGMCVYQLRQTHIMLRRVKTSLDTIDDIFRYEDSEESIASAHHHSEGYAQHDSDSDTDTFSHSIL